MSSLSLSDFRVKKGSEEPRPPSADKLWVSQHYALFITDVLRVNLPPCPLCSGTCIAGRAPSGRAGADPSPYPGRVFQGIYFLHRYRPCGPRVFSSRTALISCLSWVSALCRFQAARLAAIAMLISASAWASPLQPRPGSLVARGGAIRSAVCSMAVVKAVSTSSTLLPLGGNALRWSPIAVATCWRNWGSVISLRPVDRRRSLCLPHRSVASEATKQFNMCCDDVVIRDR